MTKAKKIEVKKLEVYGTPETTDGILRSHEIHIKEDGESVPFVQEFTFHLSVNGLPNVRMVTLPETIEIDIGNVQIDHDIDHTRIFQELRQVLLTMDYEFRLAWNKKKDSWRTSDLDYLMGKMDNAYNHLNTVIMQIKKGERSVVDVAVFGVKIANYAMLIADRARMLHEEKKNEEKM